MTFPRIFKRRSRKSLPELAKRQEKDDIPPFPTSPPPAVRSKSLPLQEASTPPLQGSSSPSVAAALTSNPAILLAQSAAVPNSNSTPVPKDAHHDVEPGPFVGSTIVKEGTEIAKKALLTVDTSLNVVVRKASSIQKELSPLQPLLTPIETLVQNSGAEEAFKHTFSDTVPALMSALDEVAKLHVFIGVAVLAFKTVYTLDMKRRENDKKVDALRSQMKDMMTVLLQLRGIKDEDEVGPDNQSIKGRMEHLIHGAADDIRQCANACDAYLKTRVLTRVLKGTEWNGTLVGFSGRFEKRKKQFLFAVSVHTGLAIDHANEKLDSLQETTEDIRQSMEAMRQSFSQMLTPLMKQLDNRIRKQGIEEVKKSDSLLQELNELESKATSGTTKAGDEQLKVGRGNTDPNSEFKDLKKELQEDPGKAVANNLDVFNRKFEMQKKEIVEEVDKIVTRESDRVIKSVLAGPHERILDTQIYTIWKDMGWRGNVKARHFVLALRDFFHEQLDERRMAKRKIPNENGKAEEDTKDAEASNAEPRQDAPTVGGSEKPKEDSELERSQTESKTTEDKATLQPEPSVNVDVGSDTATNTGADAKQTGGDITDAKSEAVIAQPADLSSANGATAVDDAASGPKPPAIEGDDLEWTLEWITITRLQSIVEAFDDDASGFLTVAEVNKFTTARPRDWSLLHWLAYWAIGWQISATIYRDKIEELLSKMFALRPLVHPVNRVSVDQYFRIVWWRVAQTTMSFTPYHPSDTSLATQFQSYTEAEEERIRKNLEEFHYDIDAMDTLALITGPGRIEKYLFPLVYLLLKRDYERLRLSLTLVLNSEEMWDAADTIMWVYDAVTERHQDLEDVFKQQKLDADQQFKVFACGMYNYWHDRDANWSPENFKKMMFPDYVYDESTEGPEADPKDVLEYNFHTQFVFDTGVYDESDEYAESEEDKKAPSDVHAVLGRWNGFLGEGDIYPLNSMLSVIFHASPSDLSTFEAKGIIPGGMEYTMTGHCEYEADGRVCYTFAMIHKLGADTDRDFRGYLDENSLTGKWGIKDKGEIVNPFVFKRVPQAVMCCFPPPAAFEKNKAQALWQFAIAAVRDQVLKKRFSWTLLKTRRDNRKRYIQILFENTDTDDATRETFAKLRHSLTVADTRCYYWMTIYLDRTRAKHFAVTCDVCGEDIVGSRAICIDCVATNSIDICDSPACLNGEVSIKKRTDLKTPHIPSHTVYKSCNLIHYRDYGRFAKAARDALQRANEAFKDVSDLPQDREGSPEAKLVKKQVKCFRCKDTVSQPCWCCMMCTDLVFICEKCNGEQYWRLSQAPADGAHLETHPLVRCTKQIKDDPVLSAEQQFKVLHSQMDGLHVKVGQVDDKLVQLERAVTEKVAKVERSVLEKMERLEKLLEQISHPVLLNGSLPSVFPAQFDESESIISNGHIPSV